MEQVSFPDINSSPDKQAILPPCTTIPIPGISNPPGGVDPKTGTWQFNPMTKLATTLKKEFFELLPPTIYFFVALHIVAFVRVLMLKGTGIAPSSSISIAVAALIMGKAVLIADMPPSPLPILICPSLIQSKRTSDRAACSQ